MSDHPRVAIFWDYENCNPPSSSCGLGYDIVNNISRVARLFGSVTTFRAYLDISAQSPKSVVLRSELQSSGVSMIDCPHNGKKDVVDKMILVDMLAFAVDHPAPATIILITGDRDYAYAVSILKLRKYQLILVAPSSPHVSPSLESQASLVVDWSAAALRTRAEAANPTQSVRQPYLELDVNLVNRLLKELQDPPVNDPNATTQPHSTTSPNTPSLRRVTAGDLLESSKHHKETQSFDAAQELAPTPASPRKSRSAGNDPALAGLSIPRTPSRSRCASISAASTRTRGTTIINQSPPAVEQDTPVDPSPPGARQPGIPDTSDIVGPAKRGPSVLPSLNTVQLPLDDTSPPSPIIIRSPLASSQALSGSGKPTTSTPASHRLNCLAAPFTTLRPPTGLGPIAGSCDKQPQTTIGPTSPIAFAAKTLPEIGTRVWRTPQIPNGIPKGNERVAVPQVDANDTDPGLSVISHSIRWNQGSLNGTDTAKSNGQFIFAPHTTYSPPSRNVALDTPPNKLASYAATPPGARHGVDSPSTVFSRVPNTLGHPAPSGSESVPSPSALPSTPPATTVSHERDESGWPQSCLMFKPLIELLLAARARGIFCASRSTIAVDLVQSDKEIYRRAGVSKFRDYTALAEKAGIIKLGSKDGGAWIALHPNWFGMNGNTTAHVPSNNISSPTSDPPGEIQSLILTGPKSPLMERTTVFQSPTFTSPRFNSPKNSNTRPTSIDRQDGAPRASIPAQFQPLIDILIRTRAEGFHQTLRSVVGQLLDQDVYARAGVSGFKEYIHHASQAQLIQFGGVGGYTWIRLHPELRI